MDHTEVGPAAPPPRPALVPPVLVPPVLVPPVQVGVRCTACAYERSALALHAGGLEQVLRCERCREPNEVLWHRAMGGPACSCCSPV